MNLLKRSETALSKAAKVILQYDSSAAAEGGRKLLIFERDRCEINDYLQAVDVIVKSMESSHDKSKVKIIIQTAKKQLKSEFQNILNNSCLSSYTEVSPGYSSSFSTGGYSLAESIVGSVQDLSSIAERMKSMGYPQDCKLLYRIARKSHLDANFKRIGIEKLSIAEIQRMQWAELEERITLWIRAAQFCIESLFWREKIMCQEVFEELEKPNDDASFFMEIVKDHATVFFSFVQGVSSIRPSAERLFKVLDLHQKLVSLLPDIENTFNAKSSEWVQIQAKNTASQLADAARDILHNFEHSVLAHSWSVTGVEEGVHPLTKYVIEYVIRMVIGYGNHLTTIITSKPQIMIKQMGDTVLDRSFVDRDVQSPIASHLVWIITSLHCNLKIKSKQHRDGYGQLFLMNNIRYIVLQVKECEILQDLIGDEYVQELEKHMRICTECYMNSTWRKMEQDLSNGLILKRRRFYHFCGLLDKGKSLSRKNILKDITATFEEIHRTQSRWLVPDLQLRQELHQSILNGFLPLYKSFLTQISENSRSNRAAGKYSVDDLQMAISQLFEGKPAATLMPHK